MAGQQHIYTTSVDNKLTKVKHDRWIIKCINLGSQHNLVIEKEIIISVRIKHNFFNNPNVVSGNPETIHFRSCRSLVDSMLAY